MQNVSICLKMYLFNLKKQVIVPFKEVNQTVNLLKSGGLKHCASRKC